MTYPGKDTCTKWRNNTKILETVDRLPVLIKDATIDSVTIIDGCHRMTALLVNTAFFKLGRPEIEAFLGASPRMSSNRWLAR